MTHYPDDKPKRNWWPPSWWVLDAISDLQADSIANRASLAGVNRKLDELLRKVTVMGQREDDAYAKLSSDIQAVKDGWASLVAERDALKSALESADADKAAAVQSALDSDSDFDAAKVEAADAALAELVAPPAPVDDNPPADDGGE